MYNGTCFISESVLNTYAVSVFVRIFFMDECTLGNAGNNSEYLNTADVPWTVVISKGMSFNWRSVADNSLNEAKILKLASSPEPSQLNRLFCKQISSILTVHDAQFRENGNYSAYIIIKNDCFKLVTNEQIRFTCNLEFQIQNVFDDITNNRPFFPMRLGAFSPTYCLASRTITEPSQFGFGAPKFTKFSGLLNVKRTLKLFTK